MMMKTYARIQAGLVAELITTDANIAELFHPDLVWVDVGGAQPAPGWTYAAGEFSPPAPTVPSLADARAAAVRQIDAEADAIRKAVIGERATEYQRAYDQAAAFRAAGYGGPVPSSVQSWATAKAGAGWSVQQCCDDILATGDAWLAAEDAIRAARLVRKEQARSAIDAVAVGDALAAWTAFAADIRGQLGV